MTGSVRTVRTSCVLDCPDTCSLEVTVKDERIEHIGPAKGNPLTDSFICSKVGRFAERLYHAKRLSRPLKRSGPKDGEARFVPVSWDEALDIITTRFRSIRDQWGGEAILPYNYGGSNGFLSDELLDSLYFARLGASRLAKTICAAPTSEVARDMYGKMAGVAFPDYPRAELILIWGANPRASNIHLVPLLQEAKRRGAFVALIDPIRTLSRDLVDLHIAPRPGADLPLALSLINHWAENGQLDDAFIKEHTSGASELLSHAAAWSLEKAATEAGVELESLQLLAERYAAASPAVIRCGWGLERNRNGGQAVAAILAIPALLGKFGLEGGGYTLSNTGAGGLETSRIWDSSAWTTRSINMTELAAVLHEAPAKPDIHGLFVFNCNPVATVPDQNRLLQGLEREDLFTVVFDQVMTDTARYADILLPATTFLEHHDVKRGYGNYVVGAAQPVIAPCGEARNNMSVFQELGRRMGFDDPPFHWSEEETREKVFAAIRLDGKPIAPESLREGGIVEYAFDGASASRPVQFVNVFPQTPEGKVSLVPACLGASPYVYESSRSSKFPLALLSPATNKLVNSTLGEFNLKQLRVSLHPEDARARGIESGDRVRVHNELGEVVCTARLDERLRSGVAHMPKGAWMHASGNGRTSTALTPTHINVVGGGACFNDARVDVERLAT